MNPDRRDNAFFLRLSEFKCASIGAEKGGYALIED